MSVDCLRHQDNFSALLDEQIDKQYLNVVEKHLFDCSGCAVELAELKKLNKTLAEALVKTNESEVSVWADLSQKLPHVCDLMQNEFSAFCDGELTPSAHDAIKEHLRKCSDCSKQFHKLSIANKIILKGLGLSSKTQVDLLSTIRAQLHENCTLIESELSAFIDRELPSQRHRDVTAHILECPSCREVLSSYADISNFIEENYTAKIPENLNLLSSIIVRLQVVPFKIKEPIKSVKKKYIIAASIILVGLFLIAILYWQFSRSVPMISSDDFLLQDTFSEPSPTAEAAIFYE